MKPTSIDFITDVVTFNQEILGIAQRSPQSLCIEEHNMSVRCLHEEIEEYMEAVEKQNLVGSIDAIVDMLYFGIGVLYKHGLTAQQIKEVCHAVHTANMTKKKGINLRRDLGVADAVKHTNWVGPEAAIIEILELK